MKKMKIVQLFKIYWPDNGGGIATAMERIADGFGDCEQNIVVCHQQRGRKTCDNLYQNVLVHRCSQLFTLAAIPISIRFLLDVKKYTRDADIVIYHFPYPMVDLAILFKLLHGKLVVWWHCEPERGKKFFPIYGCFIRHTLKKADQILVSSQGNIDGSIFLQPYREKCKIIPYCVNNEYLEQGKACVEHPVDKKADTINILFIGRLVWYKGCELLLQAFAAMKNKNCKLVLVGGGPMEKKLRELAATLHISVEFVGRVSEDEKKQRIAECDFLVLPSISKAEAFAIVQIEAMAFGKPVINTRLPSGVPYVSVDGITGITVPPGDVNALTEAMDKLAVDELLRKKYGKNALELVEKEYTKEKMVERHKAVFHKLLQDT